MSVPVHAQTAQAWVSKRERHGQREHGGSTCPTNQHFTVGDASHPTSAQRQQRGSSHQGLHCQAWAVTTALGNPHFIVLPVCQVTAGQVGGPQCAHSPNLQRHFLTFGVGICCLMRLLVAAAVASCSWFAVVGGMEAPGITQTYSVVCTPTAPSGLGSGNVTCSVVGGVAVGSIAVCTYTPAMNTSGWDVYKSTIVDTAGTYECA
jgi:hypothetical protein